MWIFIESEQIKFDLIEKIFFVIAHSNERYRYKLPLYQFSYMKL